MSSWKAESLMTSSEQQQQQQQQQHKEKSVYRPLTAEAGSVPPVDEHCE